jgi:hypothetical protein
VDRVGVKSTPDVVFVKDLGLEPVIYHGMNSLPSLPLLILWSSFKKNNNSLRCSTQSSQGQHSLSPLYCVIVFFCGLVIQNYDSLVRVYVIVLDHKTTKKTMQDHKNHDINYDLHENYVHGLWMYSRGLHTGHMNNSVFHQTIEKHKTFANALMHRWCWE